MTDRRPHRGRGDQRPCDVCRKRKARCVIRDDGPCEQCKKSQRPCTFDEPPRQHTPKSKTHAPAVSHHVDFSWGDDAPLVSSLHPDLDFFPLGLDLSTPVYSLPASPQPAADRLRQDVFLLGPSSDPDPFFRSRYTFDADGHHQATIRGYQHASQGRADLLFAHTPHQRTMGMANSIARVAHEPLAAKIDPFASRLFALFSKFVHPVFPVPLGNQDASCVSTFGAAVCAVSLTWRSHDASLPWAPFETTENTTEETPPDVNRLYNYVWSGISREMHAPSLETIQAALLLVERRMPLTELSDSPFNSCLMASITSMAYSLGLNRDCEHWEFISEEQKRQRQTLWWLIFIQDKWISAASGKPSAIREDDYEVNLPTSTVRGTWADVHFEQLLSLSFILSDILGHVMHWRFWSQPVDMEESFTRIQALQDRLVAWRGSLYNRNAGADGLQRGVLLVAYLYCRVLLGKARLRITEGTSHFADAFRSAISFTHDLCTELTDLSLEEFTTFWFSWSYSQFNAFSEFLPLLISMAPSDQDCADARNAAASLRRWLFAHGKYIDLMRVALCRLDACLAAIDSGNVRLSTAGLL